MSQHSTAAIDRRATTAIGILFLSAFALYGVGSLLASGAVENGADPGGGVPLALGAGVVLILANSLAVLAIGVLLAPILARRSPAVSTAYLAARVVEAVLLAVGGAALWAASSARGDPLLGDALVSLNTAAYHLGMATLGAGSVVLCVSLLRAALVPRALALWGAGGYALFALGSVLELLGVAGAGLVLAAPRACSRCSSGSGSSRSVCGGGTPRATGSRRPGRRRTPARGRGRPGADEFRRPDRSTPST
jgi:hypothetical protein